MELVAVTVINLLIFLALAWGVLYTLGFVIIAFSRDKLANEEIIALSLVLGVVLFVVLAVVLSLLHLRFLMLPIIILLNVFALVKFKKNIFSPWKAFLKDKILLLFILLGMVVQVPINFFSGFLYQDGLYFWSSQGHDGLWHVAAMEQVKNSIPIQNPGFSGEYIYNYHYLVDVLMGEFLRIFPFFSTLDLYFRFFPIIFSLMMGIAVFALMNRWKDNRKIAYLGMFFFYFTGSFGYIVKYIQSGSYLGGETVFWAAQQNTLLGNPPHAISHAILPVFFLSFLLYLQTRNKYWFIVSFLIGSTLAGFKVSGGLVMLVGLGSFALLELVIYRRIAAMVLATLLGFSNLITFKALTSPEASSFLMFLPWWFVRTTIVDRIGWMDLEFKRQHYLAQGTWKATLRVVQVEAMALAIFVLGNLGMRILGFWEIGKEVFKGRFSFSKYHFEIMLLFSMATGLIVPLFFVQKGLIYNNIQFMQYFLLIFGFFAAISTYNILNFFKGVKVKIVIMAFIAILAVPTVIGNLVELYGPGTSPLSKIVPGELEALNYLKNNSEGSAIVLNMPFNQYLKDQFKSQPRPIYAWYDTSYIAALSTRKSYLASEHVTLLGYPDTKLRQEKMKKFFYDQNFSWNKQFLSEENIDYVYIAKAEAAKDFNADESGLEVFFENDEVVIYRVIQRENI